MDRLQFTFYISFAEAAKQIKNKQARCDFYDAICAYALHETLPDFDKIADAAAMGFTLVKPTLDTSRRKAKSGQKGGSAEANDKQSEANRKQTAREKEGEKEDEGEKEKEKENECYKPPEAPFRPEEREDMIEDALIFHGEELHEAVRTWTAYKIERREPYKRTGYKSLLTQIEKNAAQYGDQAMIEVINQSMSSGYKGIMFDRLKKQKPQKKPVKQDYSAVEAWVNGA